MSTNPLAEIRTALQTALQSAVTAARWVDIYDGEDWNDAKRATIRQKVALKGPGLYVGLPSIEPGEGPEFLDHVGIEVRILACAGAVADRVTSAELAESLAWDAYAALLAAGRTPAFLHERWMAPSFGTEFQGANCTLFGLTLRSSCDLTDLEETTYEDDGEVPTAAVTTMADTDRLTAWVSEAGTWVRKYIAWATVKSLIGTGSGGGVSWPTTDGPALADGNRFAVGQLSGTTWTWVAKTGTQIKSWLKTWADGLYAGLLHKSRHATGGADALTAADIGAAAADHDHDDDYDAAGEAAAVGGALLSHTGNSANPHGVTRGQIGAERAPTPSAAAEVSGAAVAPDFAAALTLQWTLVGNVTSLATATGLADGETGMILVTLGSYALPAAPPSGAYQGTWTVTGPLVRIIIERIGSTYLWSADSLEVVS